MNIVFLSTGHVIASSEADFGYLAIILLLLSRFFNKGIYLFIMYSLNPQH